MFMKEGSMSNNEDKELNHLPPEEEEFVPVFQSATDQNASSEKEKIQKEQTSLSSAEEMAFRRREAILNEALESLEKALEMLRLKEKALDKREKILKEEYEKLMEIEAIYKKTESITAAFRKVLPENNEESQSERNGQK